LKAVRQQRRRGLRRAVTRQEQELVIGDRLFERRSKLLPPGQQFVECSRVHHRTTEDVRPGLRSLLEHHDRDLLALHLGELPDAYGRSQPGRPAADDHHVVLHGLARTVLFEELGRGHLRHFLGSENTPGV